MAAGGDILIESFFFDNCACDPHTSQDELEKTTNNAAKKKKMSAEIGSASIDSRFDVLKPCMFPLVNISLVICFCFMFV